MNFEIKIVEFKFSEYDSYNFWILILSFEFPNLNFEIKITRILFFELEFWHIKKTNTCGKSNPKWSILAEDRLVDTIYVSSENDIIQSAPEFSDTLT